MSKLLIDDLAHFAIDRYKLFSDPVPVRADIALWRAKYGEKVAQEIVDKVEKAIGRAL